jgi:hypothetical protein
LNLMATVFGILMTEFPVTRSVLTNSFKSRAVAFHRPLSHVLLFSEHRRIDLRRLGLLVVERV